MCGSPLGPRPELPFGKQIAEGIEFAMAAAVPPLACWAMGLFSAVRHEPAVTGTRIRAAAVIAVPLLMASQCAASAGAVAPPPIDETMLPPRAAGPPQPTRQHETCSNDFSAAPVVSTRAGRTSPTARRSGA